MCKDIPYTLTFDSMKEISYSELKEWEKEGRKFHLIDVREVWEHQSFNIGGILIPLGEIIQRKDEIGQLDDKPIVVYCKRGIRSMIAIQRLIPHFEGKEFYNLNQGVYDLIK